MSFFCCLKKKKKKVTKKLITYVLPLVNISCLVLSVYILSIKKMSVSLTLVLYLYTEINREIFTSCANSFFYILFFSLLHGM